MTLVEMGYHPVTGRLHGYSLYPCTPEEAIAAGWPGACYLWRENREGTHSDADMAVCECTQFSPWPCSRPRPVAETVLVRFHLKGWHGDPETALVHKACTAPFDESHFLCRRNAGECGECGWKEAAAAKRREEEVEAQRRRMGQFSPRAS